MQSPLARYCFSLLLFVSVFKYRGQDHGFFNQVWLEQGLSQSSIISMIQDKQGFIWFATQDGLNRYDGRNIDHFNFKPFNKNSISGDFIYSISLLDNALFVLSDKGIDRINLRTLQISNLKEETAGSKGLFFKSWILNNELYLLSNKGVARAKIRNNAFSAEYIAFVDSLKTENRTMVYSLCEDNMQNIYAATSTGIYTQGKGTGTFKKIFDIIPSRSKNNDNEDYFNTIAFKNGKLYFTNAITLFCQRVPGLQTSTLSLSEYQPVSSILIDKQDKVWIGTAAKGLLVAGNKNDSLYLDKHFIKNSNSRFSIKSDEITSLYQNPRAMDDIVWIGTRDAGGFNYSYSKNSFSVPSSFLKNSDQNFFGLTKDPGGIIWAGTNSGIIKIDRQQKSYSTINLEAQLNKLNRPVEAICSDEDNNVWTGFGNALYQVDRLNNTLIAKASPLTKFKNNHIFRIVPLNSEELMLCTSRGLVIYNKKKNATQLINSIKVNNETVPLENIGAFLVDSKNNWWLGGINGVYCIKQNNRNFVLKHNNADSSSLLSNRIMDMKESRNGDIIIATTKGLSILKAGGQKIHNIYSAKGLPNNFIYGLLEDNTGRFWMSTNFGIAVFNPETNVFKSYTASDGICINEFNSGGFYKAQDGELLFGGLGGLVSIYPEKQIVNKSVSDVVLRKMKAGKENAPPDSLKEISLSYWQNDLYFEFSAPDYSGEKNLQLYYRFTNKDTNWIKVNSSQLLSLSFINIAPGRYNLEVVARNNEGARSKPFSLSFVVKDPFWSTWWFYLILILLTVFLSWLIYRVRLKRKITYIQQIEKIRKDESDKVRKAAALDLHDEFGNGLTRISMLIEMIRMHMAAENKDAHKLLELISQNSNRLYQGTKDFIWSINPGKDNLYEIAIRIKDYADELFYGTNITFELNGLSEELRNIRQTPTAGRNVTMIFKESLSNILKHARASKVKLTVKYNQENIYLILEDNGVGFEMKDYKNSFGITNIQQRAGRLQAGINITSELGKGTEIILVINRNNEENDNNTN